MGLKLNAPKGQAGNYVRERSIRWKIISGCAGGCADLRQHVCLEAFRDKFLAILSSVEEKKENIGHRIASLQPPLILHFLPPILLPLQFPLPPTARTSQILDGSHRPFLSP